MVGAAGCLMCMMMISPGATIEASLVIFFVYYLMHRRRMKAYWGDMKYGILMFLARTSLYSLVEKKPDEIAALTIDATKDPVSTRPCGPTTIPLRLTR